MMHDGKADHMDREIRTTEDRLFMLDAWDTEPEPNAAFVRQLEERLMPPVHSIRLVHAGTPRADLGKADQWAVAPRPLPLRSRRARFIASHSLPWMAAAAIMAMVATTAFVGYLAAPGSGDEGPPQFAAFQSASPAAGVPLDDQVVPVVRACEVEARTLDEVIALLEWNPPGVGIERQPPVIPETVIPNPYAPNATWKLPDGPAPSQEDIDAIAAASGELWDCNFDLDQLRILAFFSDAGVVRLFYPDGSPNIGRIARLVIPRDEQVQMNRLDVGDPVPRTLYGFRVLEDGRIGVYVVASGTPAWPDYPSRQGSGEGFLVFVEQDGRWLIDESVFTSG